MSLIKMVLGINYFNIKFLMQKRLYFLIATLMLMVSSVVAQVTTSSISGKVTSGSEEIIGATIKAVHVPSGTVYQSVTNVNGRYSIQGMRPGGPGMF